MKREGEGGSRRDHHDSHAAQGGQWLLVSHLAHHGRPDQVDPGHPEEDREVRGLMRIRQT